MKIQVKALIVPVLVAVLFAACSSTREEIRGLTMSDARRVHLYVIDNDLYYKIGMRGDTILCGRSTRTSLLADGRQIPVTYVDALNDGLDRTEVIVLRFRPGAAMLTAGDTVLIPLQSLDPSQVHDRNLIVVAGSTFVDIVGTPFIWFLVAVGGTLAAGLAFMGLISLLSGEK